MKKINFFILSAVALLTFVFISCDNGVSTKLEKLKTQYDTYKLSYNTDEDPFGNCSYRNYQIDIPMTTFIDDFAPFQLNDLITVNFDYFAANEYKNLKVRIVSNDKILDNYWRELAPSDNLTDNELVEVSTMGEYSHTFIVDNPSSNRNLDKYVLVFTSEMRDGEGFGKHEDFIEFLAKINVSIERAVDRSPAGIDASKYTYVDQNTDVYLAFEAGNTYVIEYVDGYNIYYYSYWSDFVKPAEWTLQDGGYYLYDPSGSTVIDNDDNPNRSYTCTTSGTYRLYIYGFSSRPANAAYHIYIQ